MPAIGWFSRMFPVEPAKRASPKAKTPPSRATSQYPPPVAVEVMHTTGWLRWAPNIDPKSGAPPSR